MDLARVAGSGPHGRILRRDVEAARDAAPAAGQPQAAAPRAAGRRVPHSGMRRAIARRLSESKQTVPHFYLTVDCRMDALLRLRAQANQAGAIKLSVNDFIVRAAAQLRDVPEVNASWQDDAIEYHAGADISVAVATEGGLVTPIVRDADDKSLSAIAAEIVELAGRAKVNRLKPEEFTGGSLTVSNLGMYGIKQFAAIINPPQAAILAVGAAERRPVVGPNGELEAATVMTVTLSADHRVSTAPSARSGWPRSAPASKTPSASCCEPRHDQDEFRCGGGGRRPRRLRGRHPRRAAGPVDRAGRARRAGRHLPELGLHSHQGAAAQRDGAARLPRGRALWRDRRRRRAPGPARHGDALAQGGRPPGPGRGAPDEEERRDGDPGQRPARRRRQAGAGQRRHPVGAPHHPGHRRARARELPALPLGERIWAYRQALVPDAVPKSLLVVGAGAIGASSPASIARSAPTSR